MRAMHFFVRMAVITSKSFDDAETMAFRRATNQSAHQLPLFFFVDPFEIN